MNIIKAPELSLEALALVVGGASLIDRLRCAEYRRETANKRLDVGAKIATFRSAADYLDAQAAIEEPTPSFCATAPASKLSPSLVP